MATPQKTLAAVKRAVCSWWGQPFDLATTATALGLYHQGPATSLLPIINDEMSGLDGFKRGLTVADWGPISLTSTVGEVYQLSKKCF